MTVNTDPQDDGALRYDDLVMDEVEAGAEAIVVEREVAETRKARSKWPLIFVLGTLAGFAASFAASYYTRPEPFDASALQRDVAALRTEMGELRSRAAPATSMRPIERRLDALEARPVGGAEPVDLAPLEARIAALTDRIAALEEADRPPVDEALVTRLERLREEGFTGAPEADLAPLTRRLDALEARPNPDLAMTIDLEPLERRLSALENREPAQPPAERPAVRAKYPPFPSDALRDAAEARRGGGLLSKHIRVKSEDDPLTLIDGVEADLKAGRVRAALAKFDRLPEPIRNLARGWRADMEDALP